MRAKVLHVTQATGGVETSLLLLFRHLDHAKFELHLACPPGTELGRRAALLGVKVHPVAMVRSVSPLRDVLGLIALCRLMRRERYALVHAHSAKGGYLGRLAAWITETRPVLYAPRAFSYLSQTGFGRWFFLTLERWAVPITTCVVATSQSERTRAVAEVGYQTERVVVIPNAIDLTEAPQGRSHAGTPMVLTVGRLVYQKDPETFVRMAAVIAGRRSDVQFVMAGAGFAGPLERRTRELVDELGLSGRLEILPWASKVDTLGLLSGCTVFVLLSRFEGMPNTLLEAMMLARPVVVTDADGNRDLVENGVTGLVVPSGDGTAAATAVLHLLDGSAEAHAMANAGHAKVVREHRADRIASLLGSLYDATIRVGGRVEAPA